MTYIRDFQTRYQNVKREDLDINFRSSCGITNVARQVIQNNRNRLTKQMNSNNTQTYEQGDIITYDFDDRQSEINFIVSKIKQLIGTKYTKDNKTFGLDYDDMVILVSSVKKIPELIQALKDNGIDFIVEGTQKLFETNEIQTVYETFKVIFNVCENYDKNTFSRTQIQIDNKLVQKWTQYSPLDCTAIKNALEDFVVCFHETDAYEYTIQQNLKKLFADLQLISQTQDEKTLYNWGKFTEIINDFEKIYLDVEPVYKLRRFHTFLRDDAPFIYPEGWLSPSFKTIRSLRIMTYHQSKGLEFPVVFLMGLEEGIFPLSRAVMDENELEEERRLAYVGITRAEEELYLTNSISRMLYGKSQNNPASRFIEEIDEELIQSDNQTVASTTLTSKRTRSREVPFSKKPKYRMPAGTVERPKETGADKQSWNIGDKISHKAWGTGTIVKVSGDGEDTELDIAFEGKGIKRLLAAFAPITKI